MLTEITGSIQNLVMLGVCALIIILQIVFYISIQVTIKDYFKATFCHFTELGDQIEKLRIASMRIDRNTDALNQRLKAFVTKDGSNQKGKRFDSRGRNGNNGYSRDNRGNSRRDNRQRRSYNRSGKYHDVKQINREGLSIYEDKSKPSSY